MSTNPIIGSHDNPVIGGLAPEGQKWQIVDTWPPSRSWDRLTPEDREYFLSLGLSEPSPSPSSGKTPLDSEHTEHRGE